MTEHGKATPIRKASLIIVSTVVAVFITGLLGEASWPGWGVFLGALAMVIGLITFLVAVFILIGWAMGDIYGTDKK